MNGCTSENAKFLEEFLLKHDLDSLLGCVPECRHRLRRSRGWKWEFLHSLLVPHFRCQGKDHAATYQEGFASKIRRQTCSAQLTGKSLILRFWTRPPLILRSSIWDFEPRPRFEARFLDIISSRLRSMSRRPDGAQWRQHTRYRSSEIQPLDGIRGTIKQGQK